MRSLRCFETVVSADNLWAAWREFEKGKRRRPDVATFGLNAEQHVLRLARELREGTWHPGPYRLIRVRDPKRRLIAAAPVRDRVVHHALHRVVAPWWNRRFVEHSYACLPGRGTHRAVLAFARRARRYRYALTLDVARYFYRIDRARLRDVLWRHLPEEHLRRLLQRLLDSGGHLYRRPDVVEWLGWDGPGEVGRGLPIGNLTSQWWANVYLDGLDHHVCRELRSPAHQRYVDDITEFGDDLGGLTRLRGHIASWLRDHRGLELKDPGAEPMSTLRPLPYLGHVVSPDGIVLGRKARGRLPRHIRRTASDPGRAAQVVRSFGAVWMFGG